MSADPSVPEGVRRLIAASKITVMFQYGPWAIGRDAEPEDVSASWRVAAGIGKIECVATTHDPRASLRVALDQLSRACSRAAGEWKVALQGLHGSAECGACESALRAREEEALAATALSVETAAAWGRHEDEVARLRATVASLYAHASGEAAPGIDEAMRHGAEVAARRMDEAAEDEAGWAVESDVVEGIRARLTRNFLCSICRRWFTPASHRAPTARLADEGCSCPAGTHASNVPDVDDEDVEALLAIVDRRRRAG